MKKTWAVDYRDGTVGIGFDCPACGWPHVVPTSGPKGWTWNGSYESPTLEPSVRVRTEETCCHFHVIAGKLHFHADCTHEMAGKVLDMPEVVR